MKHFFHYIIDFLFPPNAEELELRTISPENFLKTTPRSIKTEFPFILSIFSYKYPLTRELILQIKYKKNKHAVAIAALALSKKVTADFLLIPIPISNKRKKERGYNQCELIIDEICKINPKISKDYTLLIRSKDIDKQTFKNRNERIENTKNIFEVTRTSKGSERILIIDDVSTTGSTLKEARETLLRAGFVDVIALTVAH